MTVVVVVGIGRGLVWVLLGRWSLSVGIGLGVVGVIVVGKKFFRLFLGCFGVVGVFFVVCEDKEEVRKVSWLVLSLYCFIGYLFGFRIINMVFMVLYFWFSMLLIRFIGSFLGFC